MKKILLHICCGPCATASLKKLQDEGYEVVGYYYNPNIHPAAEYRKRLAEANKLSKNLKIDLIVPDYKPGEYFKEIGMATETFDVLNPEIPDVFPAQIDRCPKCWQLRIEATAKKAVELGIKEIGTTLRISPYQDQDSLLIIGKKIAADYGLDFYEGELVSCFHDSIQMSKDQGMYRQKYCGCIFSREYR